MIMKPRKLLFTLGFIVMAFGIISCDKKDYPTIYMKAELSGSQEVPANASTATGMSTASYSPEHRMIFITTTHNVTSVIGAHIHRGKPGVNGPIVFPLSTNASSLASPIIYRSPALTQDQEDSLLAGGFY